MKVYWEENNVCDYDVIKTDRHYIIVEDCAQNLLRINKKNKKVDVKIENEWQSMHKKVYKYE